MSNQLIVRPFQQSDEAEVIALWHRCGLVVPHNDPQKDIAFKCQFQPDLFFVGLNDDQLVATVMAGYEGHRGWINYLAVSPERQGRGYGRIMMERAEAELKQLDCPKINLQVRTTNKAVIEFYKRLGFSIDEVISMGKKLRA